MRSTLHLLARLAALGAFVSISGCGHPVSNKLQGRWVGESVENFDDTQMAVATGWAKGTSFEFSGSTLTVAIPAEEPRSGDFKVASVRDGDVELAIKRKDGAQDRLKLKLDSEHSLRWVLEGERAIVMRKE